MNTESTGIPQMGHNRTPTYMFKMSKIKPTRWGRLSWTASMVCISLCICMRINSRSGDGDKGRWCGGVLVMAQGMEMGNGEFQGGGNEAEFGGAAGGGENDEVHGSMSGGRDSDSSSGAVSSESLTSTLDLSLDMADLSQASDAVIEIMEAKFIEEHRRRSEKMVALRMQVEKLRADEMLLSFKQQELSDARDRAHAQMKSASTELEIIETEVAKMESSIKQLQTNVEDLEVEITSGAQRLKELEEEKQSFQRRVEDPSLIDIIDSSTSSWSATSKNVFDKAKHEIIPAVESIGKTASEYRSQVTGSSRGMALAVTGFLYAFIVCFVYGVVVVYRKVHGRFTLSRLLFLGDLFCTLFWALMLFLYIILMSDPMSTIQRRLPVVFFFFQMFAVGSYAVYVYLRVVMFADNMNWSNLGELLAVVIVGHHYYLRTWLPLMAGATVRQAAAPWAYYFCYMWMFGAFMYNRIQAFAPLKQLRGKSIGLISWLRILKKRFWEDAMEVPEEIETSSIGGDSN